ncbi:TetR/AcrR family transcriptional regulator [Shewanella sp. WXL01]|uniref:TetR/AcrR family transcriptional regulator n=1 Tax=Shewanella maritima TaxID=2520507 RepID=A0A411PHN0_9GAMM|nr:MULTISPECIES: TetR/AcrR family transcriptional regulator [Shewanella]NKF48985.1 TetR/AcrR family transcriptional regulator [Shewanella sp. WXL01]QBF82870.1 TetR/AcrR family transcriptional regulator [Shewanella maritima]
MSTWEQREKYLVEVSQRCLKGHKTFDLCRSHLVNSSQISKGTIYNHFSSEADLIVAVACNQYQQWHDLAQQNRQRYEDPYLCFIFHHCSRIYDLLKQQDFLVDRVMPNESLLENCSEQYRQRFEALRAQNIEWNRQVITEIGEVAGFDRLELAIQYLRGAMINIDDAKSKYDDPKLYHQLSYALTQLIGHSSKRLPKLKDFELWLSEQETNSHKPLH